MKFRNERKYQRNKLTLDPKLGLELKLALISHFLTAAFFLFPLIDLMILLNIFIVFHYFFLDRNLISMDTSRIFCKSVFLFFRRFVETLTGEG